MSVAHEVVAFERGWELAGGLSWQDYVRLEDPPGFYYEYDEGVLLASPTGRNLHNRVIFEIAGELHDFERRTGGRHGLVFVEQSFFMPTGERDLRPDLGIVTDARKDTFDPDEDDYFEGAPDIVVEVLSPSTAHRDRELKAARYFEHGAQELWLFDPDTSSAEFYRRSPEGWSPASVESGVHSTPLLPGFSIDPAVVFEGARRGRRPQRSR